MPGFLPYRTDERRVDFPIQMEGRMEGGLTVTNLRGGTPRPSPEVSWVGARGNVDRVPIHRPKPVHVVVMSQHVILVSVNENIPLNVFLVLLQWVISCDYFVMICIAAVLLRIYCIDV